MSQDVTVTFRGVAGTGGALGTTGRLSLVADRPEGAAGGTGLGFNGAELLALSIGGCFWNDVHRVAEAAGTSIAVDRIDTAVTLAGTPLRVVRAHVHVWLSGAHDSDLQAVFDQTCAITTIATSIAPAVPVAFDRHPGGA
jgi:organic hydroperoxide reductase OsmC/OhrA